MSEYINSVYGTPSPANAMWGGVNNAVGNAVQPITDIGSWIYQNAIGNDISRLKNDWGTDSNWKRLLNMGLVATDVGGVKSLAKLGLMGPGKWAASEFLKTPVAKKGEQMLLPFAQEAATKFAPIKALGNFGNIAHVVNSFAQNLNPFANNTQAQVPTPQVSINPASNINASGNRVISSGHMSSVPSPTVNYNTVDGRKVISPSHISSAKPTTTTPQTPTFDQKYLEGSDPTLKSTLGGVSSQYDALMKSLTSADKTANLNYKTGVSDVNRSVTGSSQDLAQYMGNFGMADQPSLGVGQDYIGAQGAGQKQTLANNLATILAQNKQKKVQGQLDASVARNNALITSWQNQQRNKGI